jgi:hypothetical protein
MREQRPPDLFLILGGQALHFGDGLFQCLDHQTSISNRSTQNKGSRDVGDVRGSVSGEEGGTPIVAAKHTTEHPPCHSELRRSRVYRWHLKS